MKNFLLIDELTDEPIYDPENDADAEACDLPTAPPGYPHPLSFRTGRSSVEVTIEDEEVEDLPTTP